MLEKLICILIILIGVTLLEQLTESLLPIVVRRTIVLVILLAELDI